jgi:hypothetical protein
MSAHHTVNPSRVRFGRLMMIGGVWYRWVLLNMARRSPTTPTEREVLSTIYSVDSCNAKHDAPRTYNLRRILSRYLFVATEMSYRCFFVATKKRPPRLLRDNFEATYMLLNIARILLPTLIYYSLTLFGRANSIWPSGYPEPYSPREPGFKSHPGH